MKDYNDDFKYKYVLNRVNGKIFIKNIVSFDTETHDNNRKFTLGSIYDGKQHLMFYDKVDMKKYLIDKRHQNTLMCATNLQFDFCAIEDIENFPEYDLITRGGRFIQVKKRTLYKNKNHEGHDTVFANVFIDSLNHYAGSVESAGKIIGIHKMNIPATLGKEPSHDKVATAIDSDGKIYEINGMSEFDYLTKYNKRDTEVTYKLMTFLQDTYNHLGCEMKTTISSTALDLFKRKYLPCELIREDYILGKEVKKEIFKTYYGGRTEIFGRGTITSTKTKKWKLLDVNSLYPFCMTLAYPLPQSIQECKEKTIQNIIKYEGFSEIEVECDKMFYPLLPYRDIKRGKLLFPYGRWKSSYTHVELRKALQLGYRINKIYNQYIYTETFFPFKEYVEDLYAKRIEYKKENSPMELVVKLLLNSLYGKFGQRDFTEYIWFNTDDMTNEEHEAYLDSDNTVTLNNIGYKLVVKECDTNFIFPIFCSYVTSYGRLRLYDYMTKYNAVYTDTDSVITCSDNIDDSMLLGEMKIEDTFKKAILIRPKLYLKHTELDLIKVKVKGLPQNKKNEINVENFTKILQHDKVFFNKFTKPNESIRRGFDVNSVREESKIIELEDNKREWKSNFDVNTFDFDSSPVYINDIKDAVAKKSIHKKTVREKMLLSKQDRENIKQKLQTQFIKSDLFDINSVGSDITPEEYIRNEEWFDKRGL